VVARCLLRPVVCCDTELGLTYSKI
jgi:hypothetical protein